MQIQHTRAHTHTQCTQNTKVLILKLLYGKLWVDSVDCAVGASVEAERGGIPLKFSCHSWVPLMLDSGFPQSIPCYHTPTFTLSSYSISYFIFVVHCQVNCHPPWSRLIPLSHDSWTQHLADSALQSSNVIVQQSGASFELSFTYQLNMSLVDEVKEQLSSLELGGAPCDNSLYILLSLVS